MGIDVQHLCKRFGRTAAVDDATFRVEPGERVALVGRNGAGKTTLLRLLATFLPATSGRATVSGFDLFSQSNAVREITGYLPEGSPVHPDMGVAEYLRFRGRLRRMPGPRLRRRLHDVLDFCELAALRTAPIRSLSAGQKRAVGLADAILHEPDVLLLDDPLAALDPVQARKISAMVASPEVSEGRVVLFSTHDAAFVRAAATRAICLEHGRVVADARDLAPLAERDLPAMLDAWRGAAEAAAPAAAEGRAAP
ncbi:MAG: ABC transporter ATP-binding protein [Kiritimatiellae bacterium]|nr:ABC transporter ATP-binding protein [Kiritimatiellia bacterium]